MVKIRRGHRSRNVEYRGSAGRSPGRLPIPMPQSRRGKVGAGAGGAGLIGVVVVVVLSLLGGGGGGGGLGDIFDQLGEAGGGTGSLSQGEVASANPFLEVVFDDVQNYWDNYFRDYPEATMVIFRDSVRTDGCGDAPAAVGPFYCPADSRVYLDQSFFDLLAGDQFGAPGDFAQAYVVAHEVAHHVQNVTGISAEVRQRQQQSSSQAEVNGLSIRLELQADCLAGAWASVASRRPQTLEGNDNLLYLERGDLREGLVAAAAVGDDHIQLNATGRIDQDGWTHGSAEQREAWLTLGLESGDPTRCQETFDERAPADEILPGP